MRILAEQTHTVGAVVEKLGMSQPTISKHLKVLRDADVVSVTVEGQRRLYSLNPDVFATVTEWINRDRSDCTSVQRSARARGTARWP